jgi:hypothetical protein
MAVPPRLPKLAPEDMQWIRWATERLKTLGNDQSAMKANLAATIQQHKASQAAISTQHEQTDNRLHIEMPIATPQVPTDPIISTDHGTVTVEWDGLMHANLKYTPAAGEDKGPLVEPARGFNHVSVYRADVEAGPYSIIGSNLGLAGGVVDSNVVVGHTYWYRLVTYDNLHISSVPSTALSVVVKGVDLGTLDQDVKDAIQSAQDAADAGATAAQAGIDAAAAAQTAANTADAKAASALLNAAAAQTSANTAQTTADGKNKITYSTSVASGSGVTVGDIWYQTSGSTIIGYWKWSGTTWDAQTLTNSVISTLDAGKITTGTLSASRIGANSISATQMIAGTITAASGILADAVVTTAKIADLAVSTAKIADLAVNNAKINDLNGNKITAATITAGKLAADSVTTNNIVAGSIDTNRIAAGAISADKLDLGTVAQGNPINRVPMPLTQVSYWSAVLSPSSPFSLGGDALATATSSGITLAASSSLAAFVYVANRTQIPQSRKLQLSGVTTGLNAVFQVKTYTSPSDGVGTLQSVIPIQPTGTQYTFPVGTVSYAVKIMVNAGGGTETVSQAQVFEIIGGGGLGQSAELSPSGMRLYDANGNLAVDLSTSAQQYLNIYDSTGVEPVAVATIDNEGNINGTEISGLGLDINGTPLVITDPADPGFADTLLLAQPNGAAWVRGSYTDANGTSPTVPLLDRLGRGVIYDVTWPTQNGNSIATPNERIAQDYFVLEDGRSYVIDCQLAGIQAVNGSGVNCYVELQVGMSPNTDLASGDVINRAVIQNGHAGYWAMTPVVYTASASATVVDRVNRIMPANLPIYWQLSYAMSVAPSPALSIAEFGWSRGLTIIDVGSTALTRPAGNDLLVDVGDTTTAGASSGTKSTGTVATSTTRSWTASWSRTWNSSGSNIVTGTGQYTNGSAMYQGFGASPMGSKFGFAALGLSGKTITAMSLYLHNTYFGYSGQTALLGTHGDASAPATYTGSRANAWSPSWSQGQGKWVSVPKSLWAGFAAGTYRGFSLGVSSSSTAYGYFSGASQSNPPQIKITYH